MWMNQTKWANSKTMNQTKEKKMYKCVYWQKDSKCMSVFCAFPVMFSEVSILELGSYHTCSIQNA